MPGLQCRFYRSKYPSVEDVVMVTITSIEDMGAYVMLLEYGNVEGMILMSELSRRRIRSINKLIRVGRNEIVVVIRVDADKGYIDLSKRRVAQEERQKCDKKFAKGKQINLLLRNVSEKLHYTTDSQLEELYRKTAWYFDEKYNRDNASYDVFKRAVNDKSLLDECDIDDVTRKEMLEEIQHRLAPNPVKIRADIEVSCFGFEGIDAIKNALKKGIACSTDELPLKVNLIAPPLYVVTTTTLERTCGLQLIRKALDEIEEEITNSKGSFKVKSEPRVVTQKDDSELEKELERLEQQGKDVDGDDDSDSESSTGSSDEEKGGDIS